MSSAPRPRHAPAASGSVRGLPWHVRSTRQGWGRALSGGSMGSSLAAHLLLFAACGLVLRHGPPGGLADAPVERAPGTPARLDGPPPELAPVLVEHLATAYEPPELPEPDVVGDVEPLVAPDHGDDGEPLADPPFELADLARPAQGLTRAPRTSPPPEAAAERPESVAQAPSAPPATEEEAGGEAEPILIAGEQPAYPPLARRLGWEGSVLCRLWVDAEGLVERVEVERSSGRASLDEAAREALATWRFIPGLRAGRPAALEVLHRVTFRLRG